MAEATSSSKNLCRYYMHGVCRGGDRCNYSHDLASAKADSVCKYYQKGACIYGDCCRYDHIKTKPKTWHSVTKSSTVPVLPTPQPKSLKPLAIHVNPASTNNTMVTLKRQAQSADSGLGDEVNLPSRKPEDWVMAAEFVPGQIWQGSAPSSYLQAATGNLKLTPHSASPPPSSSADSIKGDKDVLCPYASHTTCPFGSSCTYLHGNVCDMCGCAVLHPTDEAQRSTHMQECMNRLEEDMELSFAIQRSKDKVCGICMETVVDKTESHEQRFGILSDCNHVFCLSCIRKWRSAKQFENKIVRACPECRVKSDFVTPSKYWVEDKQDKTKLITGYKMALSKKACKYFDEGRGECPFNENCFYRHAYPDGRAASPKPQRRRKRQNAEGDMDLLQQIILWDFLEERAHTIASIIDSEWDDLPFPLNLAHYSSDDDSDFSDSEIYT